jgi:hypothetical protein
MTLKSIARFSRYDDLAPLLETVNKMDLPVPIFPPMRFGVDLVVHGFT